MTELKANFVQAFTMTDFSSQIFIAITGAFIWYLAQTLLEHYNVHKRVCRSFDFSLKTLVNWFHARKDTEYCKDLIDNINMGKTMWEKLIAFLGSISPEKPPSNIPDLKESGTSGELEAKKQTADKNEEKTYD